MNYQYQKGDKNMGLDMYLNRRKKFRKGDVEFNRLAEEASEEVCYWRKANQIRQWFVDHTDLMYDDNCRIIELSKEELKNLLNDCLSVTKDHSLARKLLPTQSGFFFGSTDYDEWYFKEVSRTADELQKILKETDFDTEVIEYGEWW